MTAEDKATNFSIACRKVNEIHKKESLLRYESIKRETAETLAACKELKISRSRVKGVTGF